MTFLASFPFHARPPIQSQVEFTNPTIWIHPPHPNHSPLSADVECLKWQAYLALRGISPLHFRTDISQQGAINRRLPNIHISKDTLIPALHIPSWADAHLSESPSLLEGYNDELARDESRAWVALLEGHVHAALEFSNPRPSYLLSILFPSPQSSTPLQSILIPPPAPLTGLTSLFPPSGVRISYPTIIAQYRDAIAALSDRLGTDKWFLGSQYVYSSPSIQFFLIYSYRNPTPLDALAFAYLHSISISQNSTLRFEVTRRVNLVAWERRVRTLVCAAFVST
jgi:metaxin